MIKKFKFKIQIKMFCQNNVQMYPCNIYEACHKYTYYRLRAEFVTLSILFHRREFLSDRILITISDKKKFVTKRYWCCLITYRLWKIFLVSKNCCSLTCKTMLPYLFFGLGIRCEFGKRAHIIIVTFMRHIFKERYFRVSATIERIFFLLKTLQIS